MSKGGKGGDQTVTQKVEIPSFLKPFITQSANVGQGALTSLQQQLPPGASLVAPQNATQQQAMSQATAVANGAGGFIPTAQNELLKTAQGGYLSGSPAFDQAVQASIRAAQPSILSSFGAAGRGVSGLGQAAIQQAASDAFAGLYDSERSRQLNAAQALPGIGLAGSGILSDIGAQQQSQLQREILGPVDAQQQLLSAALGIPQAQSTLFGKSVTAPNTGSKAGEFLGGASALGSLLGVGGGKGGL
jgi:hypothetical protein